MSAFRWLFRYWESSVAARREVNPTIGSPPRRCAPHDRDLRTVAGGITCWRRTRACRFARGTGKVVTNGARCQVNASGVHRSSSDMGGVPVASVEWQGEI